MLVTSLLITNLAHCLYGQLHMADLRNTNFTIEGRLMGVSSTGRCNTRIKSFCWGLVS
jgi:hypothetical protein